MTQIMCIKNCMVFNETAFTIAGLIQDFIVKREEKIVLKDQGCAIGLDEKTWQPTFDNLDKDAEVYCPDYKWSLNH